MIEVSGLILLSSVLWVITGLTVIASIFTTYSGDAKILGAIALVLGSITFILTLIGMGTIEVI